MTVMKSAEVLTDIALAEDIGAGDITTRNLVEPDREGKGVIIAKEALVLAGLDIAKNVLIRLDPDMECQSDYHDGDHVESGATVLKATGKLCALLEGERTALNFLQRLSGIATHVRSYVDLLKDKTVRLVDTRKTTPGFRVLEKYAVRMGGAYNHRMGLFDGVLIKDNHIAVCGGVANAVALAREKISHLVKIEVEVDDFDQLNEALAAGAEVIMLDNMDISQIKKAVAIVNGKAEIEVSGGVTKAGLAELADTGVDIISSGALTHSAKAVDLSMYIENS